MLVTFSSKADMDVLMMGEHARLVLKAAGKLQGPEIPERGVFSVEQLDEAIKNLESAIKQEAAAAGQHPEDDDDDRARAKEIVLLGQRASPLLQMMRKAKAIGAPILWETGSGW